MGQCPIKLMDDEDVPTVNMLTPNNNYRLATSWVKSVEDPLAFAVIPGSMSLLRRHRQVPSCHRHCQKLHPDRARGRFYNVVDLVNRLEPRPVMDGRAGSPIT